MKQIHMLNFLTIKSIEPTEGNRLTKLNDGNGLWLYIYPNKRKVFYKVYSFNKKRQNCIIGLFKESDKHFGITLGDARKENVRLQQLIDDGVNPKKLAQHGDEISDEIITVASVAESIKYKYINTGNWNEETSLKKWGIIKNHILSVIGHVPIKELDKNDLKKVLDSVVAKKLQDMPHRVRQLLGLIVDSAAVDGLCDAALKYSMYVKGSLPPKAPTQNFPALEDKSDIIELFYKSHHYPGEYLTSQLLVLSALLFMRPSELRRLKWSQINFHDKLCTISIRKGRAVKERLHKVPLSKQAIEILNKIHRISGHTEFVFYSRTAKLKTLSMNTANQALKRMGYRQKMTAHGYRAMAATAIGEHLKYRLEVIDVQLSHLNSNKTQAAYHRGKYLEERTKMMQDWSDFLYESLCEYTANCF